MNFVKNKKLFSSFLVFVFLCFFILSANICLAQNTSDNVTILEGTGSVGSKSCNCGGVQVTEACKQYCGDYELNDFLRVGINVTKWILGIVGSLALLMFIYGGLMMIIAGVSTRAEGGKDKKINIGKDAIENAIIGLVIVFAAYMIIGFVFSAFNIPEGKDWASSSWFKK